MNLTNLQCYHNFQDILLESEFLQDYWDACCNQATMMFVSDFPKVLHLKLY